MLVHNIVKLALVEFINLKLLTVDSYSYVLHTSMLFLKRRPSRLAARAPTVFHESQCAVADTKKKKQARPCR